MTFFAVDKIKDFGKEIVNCSAEVSAEQSSFAQIMGDYSKQAQEKLQSVADATGMLNTRLTPYMTSMTAKFKGLGFGIEDSTDLAQRGLVLAGDAAAFWDKSLEDSMGALNSFINGSYEGGEAIGLFANDTQMASYAVEQGIVSEAKEWANLDEAKKQATRLQYAEDMMKASGATGQAAKEAGQYANVQANLTEKWRQFKAQIGEPVLQNIVIPAMDKLSGIVDFASQKFDEAQPYLQVFGDKIIAVKDKAIELGNYAGDTFAPVIDRVSDIFQKGKDAVQPLIDVLGDYIGSGEAASDITNILKDAIDVAAGIASTLLDGVNGIAQGFQDMYTWGQQNTGIVTALGIAFLGLVAAIAAYNSAKIVKKALDIAETVQIYGLIAAEAAHTVATTVATAATTAFGVAVAFLTSPITIVIAIITALVAAGVLLYKNWDVVKAKCAELGQKLSEIWGNIKAFLSSIMESIKANLSQAWESIKSTVDTVWNTILGIVTSVINAVSGVISSVMEAISGTISGILDGISSTFSSIWEGISSTVSGAVDSVQSFISDGLETAKSTVSNVLDGIKGKFTDIWNGVKDTVSGAIDFIKGIMNFEWSLPDLKLPHFSINGSFSLNPPSVPSFGIEWYKKAMDSPMVLDSATIFGYNPSTRAFLGGGEAGTEVVSGVDTLKTMIRDAVSADSNGNVDRVVVLLEMIFVWLSEGGLKEVLVDVLTHDVKLRWEGRELARLVRTYA